MNIQINRSTTVSKPTSAAKMILVIDRSYFLISKNIWS